MVSYGEYIMYVHMRDRNTTYAPKTNAVDACTSVGNTECY